MLYTNKGFIPKNKSFKWGELSTITIGREGRGRSYTNIPCDITTVKGIYHGIGISYSRNGRPKIVGKDTDKTYLHLDCEGVYTRNTVGRIEYILPTGETANPIKLLEIGHGAYGEAGRIGTFYEYLIEVVSECIIRVKPSGGESKCPSQYLLVKEGVTELGAKKEAQAAITKFGLKFDLDDTHKVGTKVSYDCQPKAKASHTKHKPHKPDLKKALENGETVTL